MTAAVAFNPRPVQQALHALKKIEPTAEVAGLLRDLAPVAQALAELGCGDGEDATARRARGVAKASAALLRRTARFLFEKVGGRADIARALDLQASALHALAERAPSAPAPPSPPPPGGKPAGERGLSTDPAHRS